MAEYQTREALEEQGIIKILQKKHDVHGFDDMPAGILGAFVGMWGVLLATLWLFFATDKTSAFAVAIATGFVLIFFAVPRLMIHQLKPRHPRPETTFITHTGPMSERAAATQVLLIPSALTFTLLMMGLIKHYVTHH